MSIARASASACLATSSLWLASTIGRRRLCSGGPGGQRLHVSLHLGFGQLLADLPVSARTPSSRDDRSRQDLGSSGTVSRERTCGEGGDGDLHHRRVRLAGGQVLRPPARAPADARPRGSGRCRAAAGSARKRWPRSRAPVAAREDQQWQRRPPDEGEDDNAHHPPPRPGSRCRSGGWRPSLGATPSTVNGAPDRRR